MPQTSNPNKIPRLPDKRSLSGVPGVLFILTTIIAVIVLGAAGQVRHESRAVRAEEAPTLVMFIPTEECNSENIIRQVKQHSYRHQSRVLRIVFVHERQLSATVVHGKGRSHTTFEQWRSAARRHSRIGESVCAEFVKLNDRGTARFAVPASSKPREQPVQGSNAYRWTVQGCELELLHVSVNSGSVDQNQRVALFFRTGCRLTKKFGRQVLKSVHEHLGESVAVEVSIRNDGHFVLRSEYPWVNPFDYLRRIPTWEQYRDGEELYCEKSIRPEPACLVGMGRAVARR